MILFTKKSIGVLICSMLFFSFSWSQSKKEAIDNGYFLKIKGAPNFVGTAIDLDDSDGKISAVLPMGDTIIMRNVKIKKMYTPKDAIIFPDRKFHYINSGLFEHSYTFGAEHFSWDFRYLRQLKFPLEIGIGAGIHTNAVYFSAGHVHFWADIVSLPTYVQASYKIGNRYKFYLKGAVGLANNLRTQRVPEVSNYLFARAGIGVVLPSRNRFKHFIEFGQGFSGASGQAQTWSDDVIGNVQFSNVQFYRFTFTYGIQIGK